MAILWKKKTPGAAAEQQPLSPEQREVAALDQWVASLPEKQQLAFGELIAGLVPSLVQQARKHSSLPMDELGARLKAGGKNLLFRLVNPQQCFERIGDAFMTHAPTIRRIASAAAQACVEKEKQLEQLRAREEKAIDVPPTPALEPIKCQP